MKEIYPNIFLLENFLTDDEYQKILMLISESNEDKWKIEYVENIKRQNIYSSKKINEELEKRNKFWDDKILKISDKELCASITEKINITFNNKYNVTPISAIQRQQPGTFLAAHFDQGYDPSLEKAFVVYLNDNYNGGELFFPGHNFIIKPPSRSLIMFPGTEDYMHGVKEVLPGSIRYVLTCFGFKK